MVRTESVGTDVRPLGPRITSRFHCIKINRLATLTPISCEHSGGT